MAVTNLQDYSFEKKTKQTKCMAQNSSQVSVLGRSSWKTSNKNLWSKVKWYKCQNSDAQNVGLLFFTLIFSITHLCGSLF